MEYTSAESPEWRSVIGGIDKRLSPAGLDETKNFPEGIEKDNRMSSGIATVKFIFVWGNFYLGSNRNWRAPQWFVWAGVGDCAVNLIGLD